MADSTQGAEVPSVNGAVVAELTPVLYSLHPSTGPHEVGRVNPLPAVKEEETEPVSVFPITSELGTGVKEVTEVVVDPPEELPVEEARLGLLPLMFSLESNHATSEGG